MLAAWYDRPGAAADVLHVGELPDPTPGPGEVRVAVRVSGVNPGDTKKRAAWTGGALPYPRVIPHSDAAGTIDAVGAGIDAARLGQRVWVFGAQSYRAFGTAARYTVVPADLAVPLPDHVGDDLGASLGIPGITAHRTVFADGPVDGRTVLVQGVLGAVGSMAGQLAAWAGATVIGTVRRQDDLPRAERRLDHAVRHVVALDGTDPAAAIRTVAPGGVDRIIEVALSDNADLDDAVISPGGVIAAYATRDARPTIPFWTLLFANVTLRLLGSDDFPAAAKRQAARDLTAAAAVGALTVEVAERHPLREVAAAHDRVDAGTRGRVLVDVPSP